MPSSASGSAGVKPAPFPLTSVPPSMSPAPGTDKSMASTVVPVPLQPASKRPSVIVYDEQEFVCRPGDTWESISKSIYQGTDKYAKALQRHNQNHPRANQQMAITGQLTPGARIFFPQAYVLEERYADAIVKSPASPTVVPAMLNVPNGSQPPPAPPPANDTVPPPRIP